LLIVTLARPELFDRRPDWGADIRHLTRLALEPLPDDAMRALLGGFVPGLPERAVAAILARADGIPLYAVETVRSLVADGRLVRDGSVYRPAGELGELAIPDTLRSLIASRLDALDPVDRGLVSDAAVLCQSFSLAGLSAVAGQDPAELEARLRLLVRRELFDLAVDARSPERGQYRFVQSLIREVAYGTLSRRERRARHLAAARYFEALGDDELAGALASHYVAAHEASADGAEADAVAIQARIALSGAAARAATLGAHGPAVAYLRQAIALTADPAERGALLLRAAASANAAARHDEAEAFAIEAVELGRTAVDASAVGAARALLGEILIDDGRPPEASELLAAAAADMGPSVEGEVRAAILSNLSRAYMRTGAFVEAVRAADEALDLAEHLGLERLVAETFNNKGSALGFLGRGREAIALLGAAVDLAQRGGFVAAEVRARSNLAGHLDDGRARLEAYRVAGDLARRVGVRSMMLWAAESARFQSYTLAEDWDAAIAEGADDTEGGEVHARGALDDVRRLSISALMLVARGEPTDDLLRRLETVSSLVSDPFAAAAVHGMRSDRAFVAGDLATAYEEAMLGADEPQAGTFYLDRAARAAIAAADLARAREALERLRADPSIDENVETSRIVTRAGVAGLEGRRAEAIAGYLDALARCRARNDAFDAARYGLELVRLVGLDEPAVRSAAEEARAIFQRVGARPYLETLEAAMDARQDEGTRPAGGTRGQVATGASGGAPAAEANRP
jgi:tetratricopeptide (TPR) repeat protein